MATWLGSSELTSALIAVEASGAITPAPSLPVQAFVHSDVGEGDTLIEIEGRDLTPDVQTFLGQVDWTSSGLFDFLDHPHVIERAYAFGNVLSEIQDTIEIFFAFRRTPHVWEDFINNAGVGVELEDDPPLPVTLEPMTGYVMTLVVSPTGVPIVDSTIDFVTDAGTIIVPISFQRIVLWSAEPELPFVEELEFYTDIFPAWDGTEQRASPRKNPRQAFYYTHKLESGAERSTAENMLFGWRGRNFGVPVWWDVALMSAAASTGASTVNVEETAYRDFRAGGFAAIFVSRLVFDVLQIATIGATSITFESPLTNDYPAGTRVLPLAACITGPMLSGERYRVNLSELEVRFQNTDNDVDLADVSGFSSFNGKVLIDDGNSLRGGETVRETFERHVELLDGEAGLVTSSSSWSGDRRGHYLVVRAHGKQAAWELRGLVHALRGRQVSFYVPRGDDDLEAASGILNGTDTIEVANWGYAQFVQDRQPKNVILITFSGGTASLLRTIIGSAAIDDETEEIQVNANWPSSVALEDIERIEFVEKLRLDDDRVRLEYDRGGERVYLTAPVKAVLE